VRRSPAGDRRIFQRLSALLWIDEGRAREEVAELLGVSSRQVGDWLRIFRDKGLDELCTLHYRGDPGRLRPAQVERLQQEIATGAFHNAEQVRAWIEEQFGVTYSASGVKDLLHRIGASYHKVSQQAGGPGVACPPSAVSPGVPAGVLAQPEPDRAPVEVREEGVPVVSVLRGLRPVQGGDQWSAWRESKGSTNCRSNPCSHSTSRTLRNLSFWPRRVYLRRGGNDGTRVGRARSGSNAGGQPWPRHLAVGPCRMVSRDRRIGGLLGDCEMWPLGTRSPRAPESHPRNHPFEGGRMYLQAQALKWFKSSMAVHP
jgi:transposase